MRHGVRLGIDVGTVRVGLATSDREGILASPLETIPRDDNCIERLVHLMRDIDVLEVYVGLPLSLSGATTASTQDALTFAQQLQAEIDIPVLLVDERLTTVSAHGALRASGKKASRSRSVVDQVAAVMLLQHALDTERVGNVEPGRRVTDYS